MLRSGVMFEAYRNEIPMSSVTKLTDRGSHQTLGIVMDASSFLRELALAIKVAQDEPRPQ